MSMANEDEINTLVPTWSEVAQGYIRKNPMVIEYENTGHRWSGLHR